MGGADALTWSGGDAASSVAALLGAVQRLLGPEVEDRGAANVGGLLLELLRHAGPHVVSGQRGKMGGRWGVGFWGCLNLKEMCSLSADRPHRPTPPSPQVPSLPALLGAVAGKLEGGEDPALVQALLAVLAQLIHLDLPNTVATLAAIPMAGEARRGGGAGGGAGRGLAAVARSGSVTPAPPSPENSRAASTPLAPRPGPQAGAARWTR